MQAGRLRYRKLSWVYTDRRAGCPSYVFRPAALAVVVLRLLLVRRVCDFVRTGFEI